MKSFAVIASLALLVVAVSTSFATAAAVEIVPQLFQQQKKQKEEEGGEHRLRQWSAPGSQAWNLSTGRGIYTSPTSTYSSLLIGSNNDYFYNINKKTHGIVWTFDPDQTPVASTATVCLDCGKFGVIAFGTQGGSMVALGVTEGYKQYIVQTNGSIYSRPYVYNDQQIFFGSYDHYFYSVMASTGAIRWKVNLGAPISAGAQVFEGNIIVGSFDKNVYAISPLDGSITWKFLTGGEVTSACSFESPAVFCSSNDGNIYALDVTTGKLIWKYATNGRVQARPEVSVGTLWVGSFDGFLYAISTITGKPMWTFSAGAEIVAGVAHHNDKLYFGTQNGDMFGIFTNGTTVFKFKAKGGIVSRPLAEDKLYFGDTAGYIYALNIY